MTREVEIFGHSIVVASADQVSCDLNGEAAILNLQEAAYYGLDEVGSRIWALLQQPHTVGEICNSILEEYDVEAARCEHDVLVLLQQLAAAGLIDIQA